MGTRHLICVAIDGKYKIAQYGQWDGYPSGQGVDVLDFCKGLDDAGWAEFRERCRKCSWLSDTYTNEQLDAMPRQAQEELWNNNPQWSRDNGARILEMVAKSPDGLVLRDSSDFAQDGLFCEWAYVIDLDTNVLEAYKGFQEPATGRFAGDVDPKNSGYGPVKKVAEFPLNNLPSAEEFESILDPDEPDE